MEEAAGRSILIADDSMGHRKVVELLLSAHNYEVVAVADGHDALTYLQSNTPQLAILDVNMPYMTGIEVCARVKRLARLRSLPIIIMTSLMDDVTKREANLAGADLLVHKPLTGQSILSMLKQASAAARQRTASLDQASGDSPSPSSLL